jgi:hypothetical protein
MMGRFLGTLEIEIVLRGRPEFVIKLVSAAQGM